MQQNEHTWVIFFLWAGSFPKPGLFKTWASPRQGPSGHQLHDKLHVSETNLWFKIGKISAIWEDIWQPGVSAWQRCEELGSHKDFPMSVIPRGQGTCVTHGGVIDDTHSSGCLSPPTHKASCQRSDCPPGTFGWSKLKPCSSPFWQINGFHWRISLSFLSTLGRAGGKNWGLGSWVPGDQTLDVLDITYLWKATEEGSQHGAALFVRARLDDLVFDCLGGRMETFAVSVSCLLTMKHPLSHSCSSMETLLDIIIYGVLVTLETK